MNIINLGILAHVDAGKTTTVEQLLFQTGAIRQAGSVDNKNTHSDWLSIEKERGISIRASSVVLHIGNIQVNIIDTPGHMDFVGEVERSLAVMDAVVLIISASEGIQSQTEILWRAARDIGIPTLIFVNKADHTGCDLSWVTDVIKMELSPYIVPLNTVINAGTRNCKVVKMTENDLLCLCDHDDELAMRYLNGTDISSDEWNCALSNLTRLGLVFPLIYGAASLGEGISDLINAITSYLPVNSSNPQGEVSGTVFKVEHDKSMGKIAHIRLFSGSIKNRDLVRIRCNDEKVTQIRKINGAKYENVGAVYGGDIAAVCGLTGAKAGDIIGEIMNRKEYKMSAPLYSVQATASGDKQTELLKAVQELSDEDPLLDYMWSNEERELSLKIMGNIQLEVLIYLLKERYNLDVAFTSPTVIYKETPLKSGIGYERYTMHKPCWAVVKLAIEPLPRGSGFEFNSVVGNNDIFLKYQNHIKISIPETLKQGLYGWEVIDLKVTLIEGEHHIMHTHPMDFFLATPIAVMTGLTDCGSQLLEPVLKMRITADENLAGRVIGDILLMRGTFDNPVITGGKVHIYALVPAATSMDYPLKFSSLTGGRGILKTEFSGYHECNLELGAVAKRRGVNPLDRAKWILYKRNAL